MSFRDLAHGPKGHASKQQPKQRRNDEDSSFERAIRANVQDLQDAIRKASEKIEQVSRNRLSKRASDSLERDIEKSEELSEEISRTFRDWTVHLAGEPAERHRKKFSFEKLQKAFNEELTHLKSVTQQVNNLQQEALLAESKMRRLHDAPGSLREFRSVCDNQDDHGTEDESEAVGVQSLTAAEALTEVHTAVAQERDASIRRIQCQVSEVNQMFRDFASIVQEQGVQFESIERQAESAATNSSQAVQELRKAADRQRSTRERLCLMLAVVVALLCFVIIPQTHMMHPQPEGPLQAIGIPSLSDPGFLAIRPQKSSGGSSSSSDGK